MQKRKVSQKDIAVGTGADLFRPDDSGVAQGLKDAVVLRLEETLPSAKPVEARVAKVDHARTPAVADRGHDGRSHPSEHGMSFLAFFDGLIGSGDIAEEGFGGERKLEQEGLKKRVHGKLESHLSSPFPLRPSATSMP
ncbi:hypothetical protein [Methylacidimicrobium tartarophylax]|uniref:hypothetical protein n=1 Tax=Methylacidimicrobium tartarophylax TaxID=1041768 RepID=UPI0015B6E25F|nr:hypothetical protein [Methylacidimicrobium tartarophylax]